MEAAGMGENGDHIEKRGVGGENWILDLGLIFEAQPSPS